MDPPIMGGHRYTPHLMYTHTYTYINHTNIGIHLSRYTYTYIYIYLHMHNLLDDTFSPNDKLSCRRRQQLRRDNLYCWEIFISIQLVTNPCFRIAVFVSGL